MRYTKSFSAPRLVVFLLALSISPNVFGAEASKDSPNILFLLTDDHRWDGYQASGNERICTPNLDRLADQGVQFKNAFVTLAICSPSRAACLTGRYGSANGVTTVGKQRINRGEPVFAKALRGAGYSTGVTGKWHLKTTPEECGFDFASTCWANGTWYNRRFTVNGENRVMPGFVDDVAADESIRFIRQSVEREKPFMLWMCTQVPHMDHRHTWPAEQEFLDKYSVEEMVLPATWDDDLTGKPGYLNQARNRTKALEYGYDQPENILKHSRDYYASVQQMDAAVGRVFDELDRLKLRENTWIIFMGDNGWMLGEHGMTSKVLPYEESMRVPMVIAGPGQPSGQSMDLVLNIDVTATIYELANLPVPSSIHGHSLLPLLNGETPDDWRQSFLYEAPSPQLGSEPLWAVRDERWKYIETQTEQNAQAVFAELYDLESDAIEMKNLAGSKSHQAIRDRLANDLRSHRQLIANHDPLSPTDEQTEGPNQNSRIPAAPPEPARTDIHISGIYPHLTTYGVYSQNGAHQKSGHNECGIGAIVPWAGKLWMVNYAPHMPKGSEHKLFSVDPDLSQPISIHPDSVGGTPAGRMIHQESNQLFIGHHVVDANGKVRTIPPSDMPIRVTAIARHLSDPANMVYYVDMEGSIWEANVHTLDVKQLFKKPVPGWHGKGGYTSQGRLVVSNNGELHVGNYNDVLVGGKATNEEERGVLAEFDGTDWKIVERRQFTEVTGPAGISGGGDSTDPLWAIGWDRRSLRLKVLDGGKWHTYLLPKAAYCNDASHGWYTEWPRIRRITDGRMMMDMHGMFFDFPKTFSSRNSVGIKPIGSHLRYVPDFCDWNGRLVLASDETSIQGNKLAGQPQSNLWFGQYEDLKSWGPASGYGGPWIEDKVEAGVASDPFLVDGFDQRMIHLAVGQKTIPEPEAFRATDQQKITSISAELSSLPRVSIDRGDWHKPAPGFEFQVDSPVTVFLAVDQRGGPKLPDAWRSTKLTLIWGKGFRDTIYSCKFPAGRILIPGNSTEHTPGSFGMPHTAFVKSVDGAPVKIKAIGKATATTPDTPELAVDEDDSPVSFALQVDRKGDGKWTDLEKVEVAPNGYVAHTLPGDLDAVWLRLIPNRDCIATAFLHQTSSRFADGSLADNQALFAGLADLEDERAIAGLVYAAKRNRNLRIVTPEDECYEFSKSNFEFTADQSDPNLKRLLEVEPEFSVDEASVIIESRGKRYRLPKGADAFDKPFASGWPRASREVESERHLANIHGTFYEVPLITNGAPPAWNLMRPVSSHSKQIADFCSWNGLLVLSGVKQDAATDGHVFRDSKLPMALWFGGVDDLWKLGKPVGHGGPWKNTSVRAGAVSDSYLMTGYDHKTLTLRSSDPTTIAAEIDITGHGVWVPYRSFVLDAKGTVTYEFPPSFSATWIRFRSSARSVVDAQLIYE